MPAVPEPAFLYAVKGMDSASNSALLSQQSYARATNVQIKNQLPTTRPGHALFKTSGAEGFEDLNVQGASFYNAAKGQSAQTFAEDLSSVVIAAGGLKFHLKIEDTAPGVATAAMVNVTGDGLQHDAKWHLSYLAQCENFMLACDGNGDTWVWDGSNPALFSPGFNTEEPEDSRVPNAATCPCYVHGRISIIVDARKVLTGDIIHGKGKDNSKNILKFTDQVYWATGQWFSPPSSMGNILAVGILPEQNTQHGHGDLMVHCEDGVFSINLNVYPRESWSDQVLVKHLLLETGARGPYALTLFDGDQFFRSRNGVQSLRSAAAQPQQMGNPLHPMSEEVDVWLKNDFEAYLDFASMVKWARERRLFCTTAHTVDGFRRSAKGIVVHNFATTTQGGSGAWEGLWTLPPDAANPIQMVNGIFNRRDRLLCISEGNDGKNRIGEFGQDLRDDVMEDGTKRRISCQLVTREMSHETLFTTKVGHLGILYLRGVEGVLDWGVWVRTGNTGNWTYWRSGKIDNKVEPTGDWEYELQGGEPFDVDLPLGAIPKSLKTSRTYQFLVRWKGYCSIEGLAFIAAVGDGEDGKTAQVPVPVTEIERLNDYSYSDWENSSDENRWEDNLPKL
jgi:hypothetical protein